MASIVTTAVFVVICYVFGKQIIGIFTNDKQILEIAYFAVKLGTLSYFMVGLNIGTIVFYQAIEMPKLSTLICLFRSVIFLPISLFVLSKVFGADGIWAGTLVSESLTFIAINLIANIKTSTTKSINKLKLFK